MSMREREGLIARVRQIRRTSAPSDASQAPSETDPSPAQLQALAARIAHLEELLEGLQDSVYRESQRSSKRIAELEARIDPAALAAALSRDARERGF